MLNSKENAVPSLSFVSIYFLTKDTISKFIPCKHTFRSRKAALESNNIGLSLKNWDMIKCTRKQISKSHLWMGYF